MRKWRIKTMENQSFDLTPMKKDAFYAYLEFCEFTKITPEKQVYETMLRCDKGEDLDSMTAFFENEHGMFEKGRSTQDDIFTANTRFIQKYELKSRSKSQKVNIDEDDEKKINQEVTYDPFGKWLVLGNDGNEISLSLENYHKLVQLADDVIQNK